MSKQSVNPTNDFCPQSLYLYGTYTADGKPNFGLFCWFGYAWDGGLAAMACIGGDKLTKDRIRETGVFSANLVTKDILPLADYLGSTEGYSGAKAGMDLSVSQGVVLPVPILDASPVSLELEVTQEIALDGADVFLCRVKNVLMEESAAAVARGNIGDQAVDAPAAEAEVVRCMNRIRPVQTTCTTYFEWDGTPLGAWGEPMKDYKA